MTTGNVHVDFTRLQTTRLRHDGPEVGGQANPAPKRIGGGWRLDYLADEAVAEALEAVEMREVILRGREGRAAGRYVTGIEAARAEVARRRAR